MSSSSIESRVSDELLTERIMQGDQHAFRILFERYRMPIYRFCLLMLGERPAAEDVYQEAFISLYSTCRRGETIRSVRAYLLTIARRRCLNHLRSDGKHVPLDDSTQLTYEVDHDLLDLNNILQEALLEIPAQYREALLLFEMEGYSYRQIADSLGVSDDIVRNRIYRAKKALQKILDPILDRGTTES